MNRRGFLTAAVPFAAAMRAMSQGDAQWPVVPVGGTSAGKTVSDFVTVGIDVQRDGARVLKIANRSGKTVNMLLCEMEAIDP